MKTSEILQLLEDCENRESRMTDWERGFIDSLRRQYDAGRILSVKQQAALELIWDRLTEAG